MSQNSSSAIFSLRTSFLVIIFCHHFYCQSILIDRHSWLFSVLKSSLFCLYGFTQGCTFNYTTFTCFFHSLLFHLLSFTLFSFTTIFFSILSPFFPLNIYLDILIFSSSSNPMNEGFHSIVSIQLCFELNMNDSLLSFLSSFNLYIIFLSSSSSFLFLLFWHGIMKYDDDDDDVMIVQFSQSLTNLPFFHYSFHSSFTLYSVILRFHLIFQIVLHSFCLKFYFHHHQNQFEKWTFPILLNPEGRGIRSSMRRDWLNMIFFMFTSKKRMNRGWDEREERWVSIKREKREDE